jgi:hypothetical protein
MKPLLIFAAVFFYTIITYCQPVTELIASYSGTVEWDPEKGQITFTGSGSVNFDKTDFRNPLWDVPADVKTILIKENVTVNAMFHTYHDCTIRGEDRKTSIIFGTNEREWSKNRRDQGHEHIRAFNYSAIETKGGTTHIENLTSLNPYGFHVRGGLLHLSYCDIIDDRGGHGNNSDGFVGSDGSTVDNCYFETGDDIFKAYNNYTVINTTIHMIDNAVPIQLGWGNTGDKTVNFYNLKITGNSGRFNDGRAIIVGRDGVYTKTINIFGCEIENPNASWLSLRLEGQTLKGQVNNANINIKEFWGPFQSGSTQKTICGTMREGRTFNCMDPSFPVGFFVKEGEGTLRASTDSYHIVSGEMVSGGSVIRFVAAPESGYQVKDWEQNGVKIENQSGNNVFELGDLDATIVSVSFEETTSSINNSGLYYVRVFPNPVKTTLFITGLKPQAQLMFSDLLGRKVYDRVAVTSSIELPAGTLRKGVYILNINEGGQAIRKKIIINSKNL